MNSTCQAFRDALTDPRATGLAASDLGHATECADCAAYLTRAERAVGAVGELERLDVPRELDGRVVGALQAGARQDRAVRSLESLAPRPADERLGEAVSAKLDFQNRHPDAELRPARLGAPDVLARLVGEELAAPEAFRARRYVSSLPRLEAPIELEAALALDLTRRGASNQPDAGTRDVRRDNRHDGGPVLTPMRSLMLLAACAALVLLLGPMLGERDGADGEHLASQGPRRTLRLQEASLADLARFSPLGRDLVNGLGGGVVDARSDAPDEERGPR